MANALGLPALLAASFLPCSAQSRKVTSPSRVPKDAVLLSKIASLTLRQGKLTTSRRVDPVPQLECVGPNDVCALHNVEIMRCTNEGADYDAENIQWACKASLPEEFKLGSTEVVCEGYESSEDPYILKGSCAVEYRLLLTEKGEVKYGGGRSSGHDNDGVSGSSTVVPGLLFFAIFMIVLAVIARGIWTQSRRNPPRLGGGGGSGHGWNGGDDNDDPPPPYDGPPPYASAPRKKGTRTSSTQASSSRTGEARQQRQGPWRPGFWTGALTGAGAAYAASRVQNRNQAQPQAPQPFQQPQMPQRSPIRTPSSSSSSSTPSFSNERYESTGFGGSRRR